MLALVTPLASALVACSHCAARARTSLPRAVTPVADAALLIADVASDAAVQSIDPDSLLGKIQSFQDNHTFLQGLILAIITRYIINEIRRVIEKPVLDEVGNRVASTVSRELKPDAEAITAGAWAKLPLCILLDIAGDASEAIPILGEFTDLGFAPIEAGALKLLFQSNLIAGFGFVEEILPFTDIIPTFTLSWILANLFPTTPLGQRLLPTPTEKTSS